MELKLFMALHRAWEDAARGGVATISVQTYDLGRLLQATQELLQDKIDRKP